MQKLLKNLAKFTYVDMQHNPYQLRFLPLPPGANANTCIPKTRHCLPMYIVRVLLEFGLISLIKQTRSANV